MMEEEVGCRPLVSEAARVLERCVELGEITEEPGRLTRGFLTEAMRRATETVGGWMREAGLETELDNAGNLIGTLRCPRSASAGARSGYDPGLLVLGSHLDTVRDAGRYDGTLGVLLAVSLAERLGEALPFDVEVVAFSDEEGLRFGVPFLGSRALLGELDPGLLHCRDEAGISILEAIRSWGGNPERLDDRYGTRHLLGYLEAHIEQGPVLEHLGQPLGVLAAISSSCWLRLRFEGYAGHAGTTPMELRRDPLPAAAEAALAAEALGREREGLVATVGQLRPEPGAGNVIPGAVELSLDLRHPDRGVLSNAVARLLAACGEIAERRDLDLEHEILCRQDGVEADETLSDLLGEAAGVGAERLAIGAGHDAMIMARRMPMTMLLVRSPGGVSHHPDETVLPGDVEAALAAMEGFVHRLARREEVRRRSQPEVLQAGEKLLGEDGLWAGIDS